MQSRKEVKPPVGVIFDSDMGESIDDVLALGFLYGFDGKNEARVASVSISNSNLKTAAFCEAVGRFYLAATWGRFAQFARALPIGVMDNGKKLEDSAMLTAPLERRDAEGKPVYHHEVHKLNDTAEVAPLIRNALTAQHDQNALVVLTGPATNLVKVLDLEGAKELIARKVRFLTLSGGSFPDGEPEGNINEDIAAARRLFAEWPTPIVAAGSETGEGLFYPGSSIESDFGWAPDHPIADAYRAYKAMPYDAPAWDMAPVLYAVRPQQGYFKQSDAGTITVSDDGRTRFTPSPSGKHRYLIADREQKDRIIKAFTQVTSAKPEPRRPQFLQQQDEEEKKKQEAPKPGQAKPPSGG